MFQKNLKLKQKIWKKRLILQRKKYYSGEFVLEPGNVLHKFIFGETVDGKESTEWIEF